MDWARFHGYGELTEFLNDIVIHVTTGRAESRDYIDARLNIQSALTRTMSDAFAFSEYDQHGVELWGELTVSFYSGAAFFLHSSTGAPARPGSRQR